jgi:hypothetical protein
VDRSPRPGLESVDGWENLGNTLKIWTICINMYVSHGKRCGTYMEDMWICYGR